MKNSNKKENVACWWPQTGGKIVKQFLKTQKKFLKINKCKKKSTLGSTLFFS